MNIDLSTINMDSIISGILLLNGIYDLMCCAGILWLGSFPIFDGLSQLHPTMFSSRENSEHPVIKRLLAYWLMTYGMARTIAGIYIDDSSDICAALTYFIEAFCFEHERFVGKTMIPDKVTFVSVFSAALGVLVLLRPLGVLK